MSNNQLQIVMALFIYAMLDIFKHLTSFQDAVLLGIALVFGLVMRVWLEL